jgi:hypothetical protein
LINRANTHLKSATNDFSGDVLQAETAFPSAPSRSARSPYASSATKILAKIIRDVHSAIFGVAPFFRAVHPLWVDTAYAASRFRHWHRPGQRTLWISSRDDSLFRHMVTDRRDPSRLILRGTDTELASDGPYDLCLCELTSMELSEFVALHKKLRSLMNDGSKIIYVINCVGPVLQGLGQFGAFDSVFPDTDVSVLSFHGNFLSSRIRKFYFWVAGSYSNAPLARATLTGLVSMTLAPMSWVANRVGALRDPKSYTPNWTNAVLEFEVWKRRGQSPAP